MKKNLKKIKPFLWTLGYCTLGSALIIGDQIHKIYRKIEKATSSDVLSIDRIAPIYIYIEDPFLQEEIQAGVSLSKERLKLTRFHKWLYNKIESSFIFRNWYSYKKNLPWRYLRLAQDENKSYRIRAVRSLASLKNLTDADYQQLAQSCDLRTAVGLTRSTNNVKFLLDPPNFKSKPYRKDIIKNLHNFFLSIDEATDHPCLQYFVRKFIFDMLDVESKVFDDEFRFNFENNDFIPMCLEALLHHSWNDQNAKQIIDYGGLPILMDVYKYIKGNDPNHIDCLIVLSMIMSNISACSDSAKSFFVSGWIKILWILSQHKDIRVAAPAQKALMNFDRDDPEGNGILYLRRVFPLHPIKRTLTQPKLDVIFVHGLLGGIFITWKQRDSGHCIPKSPLELLAKFFRIQISNHSAFALHLLAPKKVPSFPIPEPGITASDEKERVASYQTTRLLDHDFFVDLRDFDFDWDKIANTYEFVLADIPIDSNTDCSGPFYGSPKMADCEGMTFSKCWPKDWLPEDCPEIRVIGVNYETNISKWTPICPISPSKSLQDRSLHLMKNLARAGVGKRPIVWVGHSMGGLLVKGVITLASESSDPAINSLFKQTKGIVFYSTPHKGSHLAALNITSQMIVWPSIEVQELRENAPRLLELHRKFLHLLKDHPVKVISFAERESTYITALKFELRFVNSCSADPDVGENYGVPLDHLCICKPAGRQSFLYQKIKNFIKEIISTL